MLKNYYGCSDEMLIEMLNGNVYMQFFCDIIIPIEKPLINSKIVSQIRIELSEKLPLSQAQKVLAANWLPYMGNLDKVLTDATCYESDLRYPTNQKLLWECVKWCYSQMVDLCRIFKIKLPRTKKSEILWIFFGIHTANALEIGRRIYIAQSENLAA